MYIQQLAFVWMEDSTTETTCSGVKKKIEDFAGGDLKHAEEILSDLWEVANGDGDLEAPTNAAPVVCPPTTLPPPRVTKFILRAPRMS
jgi:hypothetical protein